MAPEGRAFVLDASAIVEFLVAPAVSTPFDRYFVSEVDVHVPAVCDVEVLSALTRRIRAGLVTEERAREALIDYVSLGLSRHVHVDLLGRMYELRSNIAPADASYVTLAEALELPLVTADRSLARAVRRHTSVRVLP